MADKIDKGMTILELGLIALIAYFVIKSTKDTKDWVGKKIDSAGRALADLNPFSPDLPKDTVDSAAEGLLLGGLGQYHEKQKAADSTGW